MTIEASIGQTYNALGRCGLVAQAMKTCGGDANNVQATIPQLLAPLSHCSNHAQGDGTRRRVSLSLIQAPKKLLRIRNATSRNIRSRNRKNATQNNPKCFQIHSKINPSDYLGTKTHSMAVQDRKKLNFWGRVRQDACQKASKFDFKETPRRVKMKTP